MSDLGDAPFLTPTQPAPTGEPVGDAPFLPKPKPIPEPDHAKANLSLAKSVAQAMQPAVQTTKDLATIYGPIDAALSVTSQFVFGFPAYMGGAVGGLFDKYVLGDDVDPKHVAELWAKTVTMQPFTEAGQRLSATVGSPLAWLQEKSGEAGKGVTDVATKAGSSTQTASVAGAVTDSTLQMVPFVLLGAFARRLTGRTATAENTDAAAKVFGQNDAVAKSHIEAKLKTVYEKTGLDPEAVYQASKTDPTVVPDLLSSNKEIPTSLDFAKRPSIPKELTTPGYETTAKLKTGETVTLAPSKIGPERTADATTVLDFVTKPGPEDFTIRAFDQRGKKIGHLELSVKDGGIAEPRDVVVDPAWRRKGVATAMYDAAIEKGYKVVPSEAQTEAGAAFREKYAKTGEVNQEQINQFQSAISGSTVTDTKLIALEKAMSEIDALATKYKSESNIIKQYFKDGDTDRGIARLVQKHSEELSKETLDTLMPRMAKDWETGESIMAADSVRGTHIFDLREEIFQRQLELDTAQSSTKAPPPVAVEAGGGGSAQQKVLSRIVNELPKAGRSFSDWAHQMYTEYVDRHHQIFRQQLASGVKKGDLGPYEVTRLTAGTAGKAKQFIAHGAFNANSYETVSKAYADILQSVKKDPKGFEAYIVAKHALEREAAGKKTGIDLKAAKTVVREGGSKFEAAAQERVKYKDALLQYVVDAGLVSPESAAAMREAYKAHVNFYRYFEDQTRPTGAGQPRSPIKKATGSERLILDPIASDIQDTFMFLSLAEKNMARAEFVKLGPEFATKVKAKMRPIEITDSEMTRALKSQGIDMQAEGFTAFRPQSYRAAPDEIVVFENGKRNVYKVDPEVARAYNALDAASSSMLTSMLRATSSWLRAGVTLSPDFALRNVIRDALTSFVYAGSHPLKTARGAISYFKEDAAYQNWLKGGGANAAIVSIDRRYLERHLYQLEPETHLMERAWNVAKTPIEALRIVSETMENVTRLGIARDELMLAKDKATIQALSMITREGTVDFARHGADPFFQNWTRSTAFMNPALQGLDRMVRAFIDNPKGTTAKAFVSITIPSVLLWFVNHDDPRWKEIPDWQRDLSWIIFTNIWEPPKSQIEFEAKSALGLSKVIDGKQYVNNGATIRIPKPFETGVLFGSVPERILDAYFAHKPDAFKNIWSSLGNVFAFNVIPTVALPPLQQITNYNMFLDRPLIPSSMEHILPEYQYMPYTTELTKEIGHLIGSVPGFHDKSIASPLVIDNYIRGWTGTMGNYIVDLADLALRKTGVLPDPVEPAPQLADMPIIRAFMIRYPSASAQSIQDFYERYNEATTVYSTVSYLARQGDVESAMREAQIDPAMMVRMQGIHQALSNAHRFIQAVNKNQQINADEKRQLIDATYMQMILMAREGNAQALAIKKVLGEQK